MKDILGGKGANLAEMTKLKLPVPSGFTITTDYCNFFIKSKKHHPSFKKELKKHISLLEKNTGKIFGDQNNPLLLSVRSGSKFSMPGMMDTILNLGLNKQTVKGLIKNTKNERFVYDAYRRFINMFGNVVLGIDNHYFEQVLANFKKQKKYKSDLDMDGDDWKKIVSKFKNIIKKKTNKLFPEEPEKQLRLAIEAVFKSWNNKRAITYRNLHSISHSLGTAVNIQSMVFGNLGITSGTGVAFTRNPATGNKEVFGEYLMNAQGEDVVAGTRTPKKITELKKDMPKIYRELLDYFHQLEKHYKDMQDVEFTIEKGKLFILQTRTGKRTAPAAIKIAIDLVKEKVISEKTALLRIEPETLDQLLHPIFDPTAKKNILAKGLPASPGAAVGRIVFESEDAQKRVEKDQWPVILVRHETSPEDIQGMSSANGILTSCGGMTSHAAVVARGMGTCCIAGAQDLSINYQNKTCKIKDRIFREGDWISLNGSTGEIMSDRVKTIQPKLQSTFNTVMRWSDKYRKLKVRTNADTPQDSKIALGFGAQGIGLCRTEHMFFDKERITHIREMILAENEQDRIKALKKLLPHQKKDFIEIFKVMKGLPVTIRLLDPPLHEFLPKIDEKEEIKILAKNLKKRPKEIVNTIIRLREINPMLGHRGCRLSITYPEIAKMQVEAILSAACECQQQGIKVSPEIMIPLISIKNEFTFLEPICHETAKKVFQKYKTQVKYTIGTMIEIPRACLVANTIAKHAEFFSFGTNDLTQMGFGFSRDDAGKFLPEYVGNEILPCDPFQKLDIEGIGELIKIAIKKGRKTKKNLKIGICGEHGGEPSSILFCHQNKFDYVSCSPYRVPIAKLAAAQAAIN